ncbi:MAG TPA: nucleotidyltransferase domain-containing protein [Syntrophales bacterium]|nr:nucleotidyltransferase domain-containing protein [Syntrophales bacterium]
MAGIPEKPEEVFSDFSGDLGGLFGDGLASIILYGSGASGDYIPGKSDLNFLVVLNESALEKLEDAAPLQKKWRKRRIAAPLFMTQEDLCRSIDSFPLEFLNIKQSYIPVHGPDVLKDLALDPESVRLQCERELRGKALLLQGRFLETGGDAKRIRELIGVSIIAFLSIFRGLLHMKGVEIPRGRKDLVDAACALFGIDKKTFLDCIEIKEEGRKFSADETKSIFRAYLREVRNLARKVDRI